MSEYSDLTNHLTEVIKTCLIFLHDNACVELGFPINDNVLETNLNEGSVLAQQVLYEGISKEGGIHKVDINKKMLRSLKNSWRLRKIANDENGLRQAASDKRHS